MASQAHQLKPIQQQQQHHQQQPTGQHPQQKEHHHSGSLHARNRGKVQETMKE